MIDAFKYLVRNQYFSVLPIEQKDGLLTIVVAYTLDAVFILCVPAKQEAVSGILWKPVRLRMIFSGLFHRSGGGIRQMEDESFPVKR